MTDMDRSDPAGDVGSTEPAGTGLSDDQFAERVAEQTSSDLKARDLFEREASGTSTDRPAADVTADDIES